MMDWIWSFHQNLERTAPCPDKIYAFLHRNRERIRADAIENTLAVNSGDSYFQTSRSGNLDVTVT